MAINKTINLPILKRCGDRAVICGWSRIRDDAFGRRLINRRWNTMPSDYVVGNGNYLHRVVASHYHGRIPAGTGIDHIDRDKRNNTPENLRFADKSLNAANGKKRTTNTSGFVGVTWHRRWKKWFAQIMVNRKTKGLGLHVSARDAAAKVNEAYQKYFPGVQVPNSL